MKEGQYYRLRRTPASQANHECIDKFEGKSNSQTEPKLLYLLDKNNDYLPIADASVANINAIVGLENPPGVAISERPQISSPP